MDNQYAIVTYDLTREFKTSIITNYYSSGIEHGGVFFYELWKKATAKKRIIHALYKLNIRVRKGSFTYLLGPNGSGKTTLLRILATFLLPTSGRAEVMGYDVVNERKEVLEVINYIPSLLAGSIWANLRLTVKRNLEIMAKLMGCERERVEEALKITGLKDIENTPVGALSTGQQARLVLALGVMREAPVFLLDEPTMGLSPEVVRTVQDYLTRLCREKKVTMFYSTHHLHEVERTADWVILLNRGRKIAEGSPRELIKMVSEVDTIKIRLNNVYFDLREFCNGVRYFEVNTLDPEAGRYEIRLGVPDADSMLPHLVTRLVSRGARIERIEVSRPTLEDVFIYLVQGEKVAKVQRN